MNKLKSLLSKNVDMKDLGPAKKILGMGIHRDKKSRQLWLSLQDYVEKRDKDGIRVNLRRGRRVMRECRVRMEWQKEKKEEGEEVSV